jgi:hypothetical protein
MRADRTIERSYLRQWHLLIAQQEVVKRENPHHTAGVQDFYAQPALKRSASTANSRKR